MRAYQILNLKEFSGKVFAEPVFDHFLLVAAEFKTDKLVTIEGTRFAAFFEEEEEKGERYVTWESVRPLCYQIIKGKHLPLGFKLVWMLSEENLKKTLAYIGASDAGTVDSLQLTVTYKQGQASVVSGVGRSGFSLDKTVDAAWDDLAAQFFRQNGIEIE